MKRLILCLTIVGFLPACTTKSKARRDSQQAYLAGQQQAMAQWQQQQASTAIQILGDVKTNTIEWADGLTLANAIVAAEYQGNRDPREIIIHRRGQSFAVDVKRLLRGYDELLEPGDRIELRR
mgnify:CR=1 FL=1